MSLSTSPSTLSPERSLPHSTMSTPPALSPVTGRDHRTPVRMPTPHRLFGRTPTRAVRREEVEAVFMRNRWTNPDNGTWIKKGVTVEIPQGPMIPRLEAKLLMDVARAGATPPRHPHSHHRFTPTNGRSSPHRHKSPGN